MDKGDYLKNITVNSHVCGIFAVLDAKQLNSRNGPYWSITLSDRSGSMEARIWAPLSARFESMEAGVLARVEGRASKYNDKIQLIVEVFHPLDGVETDALDKKDFIRASEREPDDMLMELRQLCLAEFTHRPWRKLALSLFENPDIMDGFKSIPAAKNVHHAYYGGLLEHTLGVFNLCARIAGNYPMLDRQALLAGALFHDIGKIREFSGGFCNDYTDIGRLVGHITLGLEILEPLLAKSGLEPYLRDHLRHMILSHHGELEFGSPRMPVTAEAFALHHADILDARLNQLRGLFETDEGDGTWSPYQKLLSRQIYNPKRTPPAPERHGRKAARETQCLSLLRELRDQENQQ